jgi:Ca2+-dependent lipid-binding protein
MRAYIYQAKNLIAMDESGTSDPFVEIYSSNPKDNNEKQRKLRKTETQF